MSSSDRDLEAALAKSGERHQPPYAWQEQVWRKLEEPHVEEAAPKRGGFMPWGLVALCAFVLFAGSLLTLKSPSDWNDAREKDREAVAAEVLRMKKAIAATDAQIDSAQADIDKAFLDLERAKDDESKQRAIAARNQAKMDLKNARDRKLAQQSAMEAQVVAKYVRPKKKEKALINKCAKSNDPLCGLSLDAKRQLEWEEEVERTLMEIETFQAEMEHAFAALEAAQDEAARQEAMRARDKAKQQLEKKRDQLAQLREEAAMSAQAKSKKVRAKKKEKALIVKCAKSNDPLCGL